MARKPYLGFRPLRGLRVDVSTGRAVSEELPVEVARAVLGGRGLGAYLLLRERVYDVDPLAPANPLIFAPGPLTGSAAPDTAASAFIGLVLLVASIVLLRANRALL